MSCTQLRQICRKKTKTKAKKDKNIHLFLPVGDLVGLGEWENIISLERLSVIMEKRGGGKEGREKGGRGEGEGEVMGAGALLSPERIMGLEWRGNEKLLENLLTKSPLLGGEKGRLVDCKGRGGKTLIHLVGEGRQSNSILPLLLREGGEGEVVDEGGNGGCHWAVGGGNVFAVQLLLAFGGRLTRINKKGISVLEAAVRGVEGGGGGRRGRVLECFHSIVCHLHLVEGVGGFASWRQGQVREKVNGRLTSSPSSSSSLPTSLPSSSPPCAFRLYECTCSPDIPSQTIAIHPFSYIPPSLSITHIYKAIASAIKSGRGDIVLFLCETFNGRLKEETSSGRSGGEGGRGGRGGLKGGRGEGRKREGGGMIFDRHYADDGGNTFLHLAAMFLDVFDANTMLPFVEERLLAVVPSFIRSSCLYFYFLWRGWGEEEYNCGGVTAREVYEGHFNERELGEVKKNISFLETLFYYSSLGRGSSSASSPFSPASPSTSSSPPLLNASCHPSISPLPFSCPSTSLSSLPLSQSQGEPSNYIRSSTRPASSYPTPSHDHSPKFSNNLHINPHFSPRWVGEQEGLLRKKTPSPIYLSSSSSSSATIAITSPSPPSFSHLLSPSSPTSLTSPSPPLSPSSSPHSLSSSTRTGGGIGGRAGGGGGKKGKKALSSYSTLEGSNVEEQHCGMYSTDDVLGGRGGGGVGGGGGGGGGAGAGAGAGKTRQRFLTHSHCAKETGGGGGMQEGEGMSTTTLTSSALTTTSVLSGGGEGQQQQQQSIPTTPKSKKSKLEPSDKDKEGKEKEKEKGKEGKGAPSPRFSLRGPNLRQKSREGGLTRRPLPLSSKSTTKSNQKEKKKGGREAREGERSEMRVVFEETAKEREEGERRESGGRGEEVGSGGAGGGGVVMVDFSSDWKFLVKMWVKWNDDRMSYDSWSWGAENV